MTLTYYLQLAQAPCPMNMGSLVLTRHTIFY